ncbi:MAG: FAD-linked oxidase C-terminal domain-containing protein [Bacteroidota bacterium]
MEASAINAKLAGFREKISGELYLDDQWKVMYATDASMFREMPLGVVFPHNEEELVTIIQFALENKIPLIPRTAGTSLAGQVVGKGLVVDVSRYMTQILELNTDEHWVRVQPGVVLDELNKFLFPYGLFFGPETSTSNRCMIGGMVGNNSCGSHSIIYGSTRDHTLEIKAILSDASIATFGSVSKDIFTEKCKGNSLESNIYREFQEILSDPVNRTQIEKEYPDHRLKRRNTGYAIDLLSQTKPFDEAGEDFNLARFIAGSEGTLAFMTEIKLNLAPLPPPENAVICVHLNSVNEAVKANLIALKHKPVAVELIDHIILECTKQNISQQKNRFFVQGDPGAILIIEYACNSKEEINKIAVDVEKDLRANNLGYHFPVLYGNDINKVWGLRKAGLGLLSNIVGDTKPVCVIEDTAVHPEFLPAYIDEFQLILKKLGLDCVYYAHIGTGELHLRPVLNLKTKEGVALFREVASEIATLVKKYKGSLSGEHGDGRLRGEFIPRMIGEHNYQLLRRIKNTWDPDRIFNPGKITDAPPMNTSLRYDSENKPREIETIFDFSRTLGILRATESCNGSADCRRSAVIGGLMCPSYMATMDESATTRARTNVLREYLTRSPKQNPFDHIEIYAVMDLCLSCKGCKAECPSSVDLSRLKAEFLQHYYDANGTPFRSKMISKITSYNKLGSPFAGIYNFAVNTSLTKKIMGFTTKRDVPKVHRVTLRKWASKNLSTLNPKTPIKNVFLFADEFTNYQDVKIGIAVIQLLTRLGYAVTIPEHEESGRASFSKGLIRNAKVKAEKNISLLKNLITANTPLIGIEPSALLSFRDEYPDIVSIELKEASKEIARHAWLIDEFIVNEFKAGNISQSLFTKDSKQILVHGHCHQKSLASVGSMVEMLRIPANYKVEEIRSGCCGMAGAFGFEKEHYDVSMKVGELVLFPKVREADSNRIISAAGTSCRHQIKDGTGRIALHPAEILLSALL